MDRSAERPVRMAFGGLIALAAAMGIGRFVYTPILPFMEAGYGLSKAEAGVLASANFLGYLIGALAAAFMAAPGGRWRWLVGALGVSGLTTAAMGVADNYLLFIALRFVGGLASAFTLVFSSALVLDRLALLGRGGLSAIHFAGVGTGIAISAVLVSGLAGSGGDWRAMWLASGVLSLTGLGFALALIPSGEPDQGQPAQTSGGDKQNGTLAALIAAYGLFGFGYVITATFITVIVREDPALRSVEPLVWLVVGIAAVPSVAAWVYLSKTMGLASALVAALIVESAGVALSVLVSHPFAVIVAAGLLGAIFMAITTLGLVYARGLSSRDARRSVGMMTAAFGLGQMIGPAFAGYAYGIGDSFLIPSLSAAAALLVAAAFIHFTKAPGAVTPVR